MSTLQGYCELVNTTIDPVFTNTSNDDFVFYTTSSNQSIHFGTATGAPSVLRLGPSNMFVNGDINLTRKVAMNGVVVRPRATAGVTQNITATVTNVPALAVGVSNVTFSLSNGQNQFRFVDSNTTNVAVVDVSSNVAALTLGSLTSPGFISAGNLGMFRNRIINGDMRIAQRGTNVVTGTGISTQYLVDRFQVNYNIITGGLTQSNISLTSNDLPYQYGFNKSWRITANTANTSYSNIVPQQAIEGMNIDDLRWGTVFGSPISVSFMIRTNVTSGSTLCMALRNGSSTHSYVAPFTIATSGSWQLVTISNIPAPPVGSSWATDNSVGIQLSIGAHGMTIHNATTANTWEATNRLTLSSAVNTWATSNNYIEITGVQLEKGSVCTPFEYRPFAVELQLCQRYYEKSYPHLVLPGANTFVGGLLAVFQYNSPNSVSSLNTFRILKRATPSLTIYSPGGSINSVQLAFGSTVVGGVSYIDVNSIHENGFWVYVANNNGVLPSGQLAHFHYVASAEL